MVNERKNHEIAHLGGIRPLPWLETALSIRLKRTEAHIYAYDRSTILKPGMRKVFRRLLYISGNMSENGEKIVKPVCKTI